MKRGETNKVYVIFPHEVIIFGETENCLYYQVLHLEYNYSKGLVKSKRALDVSIIALVTRIGRAIFFKKGPRHEKNILSPVV